MILGDQVRLRAIERADLPFYVKWLNDPEVRQGLTLYLPLSMAEEEEWFESVLKREPYERPLAIDIQPDPDVDEWIFVGGCGFFGFDWQSRVAEIGLHTGVKQYWNKGFGTRITDLICKHGFETLNLNRIWLRVFETNQQAIRVYEKVGFSVEGRYREGQFLDGRYVDVMIMSMLHSEWKNR
jgi:RimJ/RimL family protein N-acetyltransferase